MYIGEVHNMRRVLGGGVLTFRKKESEQPDLVGTALMVGMIVVLGVVQFAPAILRWMLMGERFRGLLFVISALFCFLTLARHRWAKKKVPSN